VEVLCFVGLVGKLGSFLQIYFGGFRRLLTGVRLLAWKWCGLLGLKENWVRSCKFVYESPDAGTMGSFLSEIEAY
jgi:hypothetical protein